MGEAGGGMNSGYLAVPAGGTGPGVVVLHAWWGLNDFFRSCCDRLAAEGFVAFAPELFDGRIAATPDEAQQLVNTFEGERTGELVQRAVAELRGHPAVIGNSLGTIGFSFGAAWSLLLATEISTADIAAVVTFYGLHGDLEADDYARSRAAFLGHFAPDDEWEPLDGVRESEERIRAAGRDVTFHLYPGTGHWFFEQNRPDAYNAEAATLAWQRTIAFLRQHLATGGDSTSA